jgi:thiol:disulfide interchange protein DsbC
MVIAGISILLANGALADEKYLREKLAVQALINEKVTQVTESPVAGLLEVVTARSIYYTDKGAHVLLIGSTLIDTESKKNLTEQREEQLGHINFSDLPLQDALKTVKGDGSRRVAIFQDANCGYCKKLEKDLEGMQDVTIYTFMVGMLSADSLDKGIAIWCAPDREKAWHDAMAAGAPIAPAACDANPLARNTALLKKLRISGTPTTLLPSGKRLSGYATVAVLDAELAKPPQ